MIFFQKTENMWQFFFQNMKQENLKNTLAYCRQLCQILAIIFYFFSFFWYFFFKKRICNKKLLINFFFEKWRKFATKVFEKTIRHVVTPTKIQRDSLCLLWEKNVRLNMWNNDYSKINPKRSQVFNFWFNHHWKWRFNL